ncbi:YbjN domain-containing protein [Corynebacterium pygosceleis]|uniref:YbjN domain-containing protein n=1 Tax=Corynebacterium pygosceleis TaxID=2800406 RepID=A0A9Q4C8I5_9CORY|nr:YbjN domain-containing protein [Corynebacterium pygosceleis]MCK7637849.1 YbjN domain-containing protein [Corynebacterium pygosceleis]MCK7675565.1 YbjN domain-containing protein [Corynebacterium pygosceleis]MCL0121041.1 YbjN domain-containing protein [Corynebacterium pygosceleis]MCX7444611.1 YbjN domain-containing protein [Corynebacterium pygosceleis]MCX7468565.1 YbjN domain-containing protein [Corynebacterium pygosceleis]
MNEPTRPDTALVQSAARSIGLEPRAAAPGADVTVDHGPVTLTVSVEAGTDDPRIVALLRYNGTLTAADYVTALVAVNAVNSAPPAPHVYLSAPGGEPLRTVLTAGEAPATADAAPLDATARLVLPVGDGVTRGQVADLIRAALRTGDELAEAMATAIPDSVPETGRTPGRRVVRPTVAELPPLTRERITAWFAARGVEEVPFDDETETVCLSMDGTPVDIILADPGQVVIRVAARVPATGEPDPGQLLHLCNHANTLSATAAVCAVQQSGDWWLVSRVGVPVAAGLSDTQVDAVIRTGVIGAGSQLKSVLRQV